MDAFNGFGVGAHSFPSLATPGVHSRGIAFVNRRGHCNQRLERLEAIAPVDARVIDVDRMAGFFLGLKRGGGCGAFPLTPPPRAPPPAPGTRRPLWAGW